MSKQLPFSPLHSERSLHVNYDNNKNISTSNNVRSGIIERHTYKTDSGQYVGASRGNNTSLENVKINQHLNKSVEKSPQVVKSAFKKTKVNLLPSFSIHRRLIPSKQQEEIIRTENCDSTTDIIENRIEGNDTHNLISIEENYHDYYKRSVSPFRNFDSDSDCQIIEINVDGNENRYNNSSLRNETLTPLRSQDSIDSLQIVEESPTTKVLNWISSKSELDEIIVHVISDSEDDGNSETTFFKYHHSNVSSNQSTIQQILDDFSSDCVSLTDDQKSDNSDLVNSHKDLVIINKKYQSLVNVFSRKIMSKNSPEMCSTDSPKMSQATLENSESPTRVQKGTAEMSPETMKYEFYSYLKININPSAEKAEKIAQNRRSVRVKNLAIQYEKNREEREKLKNYDVRNKYMKYKKTEVVFPPFPTEHNNISDFDDAIQSYFVSENLNYQKVEDLGKKEEKEKRKTNVVRKKKYKKKKKHLTQNGSPRKLRINSSRILRNTNVRVTKNSLVGRNVSTTKVLKTRKTKLTKCVEKGKADNEKESVKENRPLPGMLNLTENKRTGSRFRTPLDDNTKISDFLSFPECNMELESKTKNIFDKKSDKEIKLLPHPSKKFNKISNVSPPFLGFNKDELITHNNKLEKIILKLTSEVEQVPATKTNNLTSEKKLPPVISTRIPNVNMPTTSMESEISESSSAQNEIPISTQEVVDTNLIQNENPNYIPLNQSIKPKSFHKSLMQTCLKRKSVFDSNKFELSDSDSSISSPKTPKSKLPKKSQTHEIDINEKNGAVFNTYFINGILVIVQKGLVSFWKQTALGNVLGAQNMWLTQGSIERIMLDRGCVNRRSSEMVLACDNSVAYIEIWTKEHKFMYRECPIADVFATIYYHRGHGLPNKKVLQLENIKGYGDDVRFAVIRNSRQIVVSWWETFSKPVRTLVHSYQLAADYQTVSSIKEMEVVSHYISSLHNIFDCDDLVLGAGNEQISVWNLRHGYLVTTLKFSDSQLQSPTESKTICLYAQCDTGFLFLIQQTELGILRLVAVNGMTQDWKQLHSYKVPEYYDKLRGVILESGVLMTCYSNGFLCWNMHTGEVLAEIDTPNELIVLPCSKHIVVINNYQVTVQHIMSYILTHDW